MNGTCSYIIGIRAIVAASKSPAKKKKNVAAKSLSSLFSLWYAKKVYYQWVHLFTTFVHMVAWDFSVKKKITVFMLLEPKWLNKSTLLVPAEQAWKAFYLSIPLCFMFNWLLLLSICCTVAGIFNSSVILFFARFVTGLVLLLRGVDGNDHCPWCHYLSCIPTPLWKCRSEQVYCEVTHSVEFPFLNTCFFTTSKNKIQETSKKKSWRKCHTIMGFCDDKLVLKHGVLKGKGFEQLWGETQFRKRDWGSPRHVPHHEGEPHVRFTN